MSKRPSLLASKVIHFLAVAWLAGLFPAPVLAQTIVWTDADARKIQRKDVTGGPVTTIVQFTPPQGASLIRYDSIGKNLYYLFDNGPDIVFQRSNLDGSQPEDISTPHAGTFALNIESRKLYWRNSNILYRSDLNGAGIESHAYPLCCLIPLLAFGDDVYLGGSLQVTKGIWRADADGSNEQLLRQSGAPFDAAYDPVEEKLYVATDLFVYRINLDGGGFQSLGNTGWEYLIVDSHARKLYGADTGARVIQRANLDGSNVEDFVTWNEAGNPELDIQGLTIIEAPAIPTVSAGGLLIMALIVLLVGLALIKRRATVSSAKLQP